MSDCDFVTATERSTSHAAIYTTYGKRALDFVIGFLALFFTLPIIFFLWIAVRLDGGPGLFGHRRIGRDGVAFDCLKLRTMYPDAEARLGEVLAADDAAAAQWAACQKLHDDPRVTPTGRILRKFKLDELPQFWNVVKGDMSLVGPRPITEGELGRYGAHADTYLSMTPGLTGLWQVRAQGNGCYTERVELDLHYAHHQSFLLDLRIMFETAGALVGQTDI